MSVSDVTNPSSRTEAAKQVLELRRVALLADLRHGIHDTCAGVDTPQSDDILDPIDAGAVAAQTDIRSSLMDMKAEMLVLVEKALERIEEGRYGICESCGDEIAAVRLRAMPFALRCTHCEQLREEADHTRMHAKALLRRLSEERRAFLQTLG